MKNIIAVILLSIVCTKMHSQSNNKLKDSIIGQIKANKLLGIEADNLYNKQTSIEEQKIEECKAKLNKLRESRDSVQFLVHKRNEMLEMKLYEAEYGKK